MNLTEHFTLEELCVTSHREIDNTPPAIAVDRLKVTAIGLEQIRIVLGVPLISLSGYRCDALNCVVGGAMTRGSLMTLIGHRDHDAICEYALARLNKDQVQDDDSQHMRGEACDFIAPRFGAPFAVCRAIEASTVRFDQLIYEGGWAHVSFVDYRTPRRSILTWKKGQGYLPGLQE